MNKFILALSSALALVCLFPAASFSQNFEYSWKRTLMDGSRTGVRSPSVDDVTEALGKFKGGKYQSPDGKIYKKSSAAAKAAKVVIGAQPAMARVKEVIGYSTEAMILEYPECALSDLFIDKIMEAVEKVSGRKVDFGVGNFGGIRVDMPKGDILLDDMLSMFPFKNQIVYLELRGSEIRALLEEMAKTRFQVLGGVKVVAEDGKILSAEIGGEPLDDDRVYGTATISFLLNGGDNLYLARNAVTVEKYDIDIIDVMLDYVKAETAAGRPVEYRADGRVIVE